MVQGGGKVHREVMPLLGDRGVGASLSPRASQGRASVESHFARFGLLDSQVAELVIGLAPTLWGWSVWGDAWVFSVIPYIVFSYSTRFWG